MSNPTVDDIKTAIINMLVVLDLLPVTSLSAAANIGDTSLSVASSTGFVPDGVARFLDGSTEPAFVVETPGTGMLQIDTTQSQAIQTAHSAGAQIVTNLTTGFPANADAMVSGSGHPVWSVLVLDDDRPEAAAFNEFQPKYRISIGQLLPIARRDSTMHPQLWTEQQTARGERDTRTIMQWIEDDNINASLNGTVVRVRRMKRSFRGNVQDYGVKVWETWLDLYADGLMEP